MQIEGPHFKLLIFRNLVTVQCSRSAWKLASDSAWKSGPVRFFIQIWEDRDRDRSSWLEIPQNRDRNRQRPVHSGFTRFLAVFNRSQTGFAGGSSVKI